MTTIDPESGATIPENATAPFPNPGETAQDYDAQAQGEVLQQYRESPKLTATIAALMSGWQAIENCAVTISKLRDPAIAASSDPAIKSVNLDRIGELVGQSRVLSSGTVLSDTDYLVLIAKRIARNQAIGSSPEFIAYLEYVFGATPFRYIDFGGMVVGIEVETGATPNPDQIALLNDGPTPRAMPVSEVRVWHGETWFGFADDPRPGVRGFGSLSDPSVGGHMAELF